MDELGLIGKETVSIDGTKIKASNSKKNNHNAKSLERKRKYHEHRINEYLQDLDKNDELEDGQPRKSAEEIQEIVRKLNECKAKIETLEKTMKETGMPKKTLPTTLKQTPTPAPQARNFTREGGAALLCTAYNLVRVINILGVEKLVEKLQVKQLQLELR